MDKKTEEQILAAGKEAMHRAIGVTARDFEKHIAFPHNRKIVLSTVELQKYHIVAEVTESKYCSAGVKVGQKLIFTCIPAMLVPEESDCPLCIRALGPIAPLMAGFWDRIIDGRDPNGGMWHISECLDPGLDKGGIGHVVFKVYARKVE
jgi:uncharacterized repeat protein (TIGR04076 family)